MSLFQRPFSTRVITVFHLLLTSSFFAPFFFHGRVLMASNDWLDAEYPLIMLARQNLRAGHLGFWNPFALCGTPTTASALFHVFYPETWALIAVPDEYLFVAVTIVSYLMMAALGVFSFLLFREETQSEEWSLLASVVYALGGLTLWSLGTNGIRLLLWFTVALWLVWSHAKRDWAKNFLSFTLVFVMMGACANLLEERYALTVALGLGIWRMRRACLPLVAAWVTAMLVTAPRWLPTVAELLQSNRVERGLQMGFMELGVLVVRLFNPEAFGISYLSSYHILRALSPALSGSSVHLYTHMPHYFGIVPLLLVTAMVFRADPKIRVWKVLFLGVLALELGIEPFTTAANFAGGFLFHHRCLHMFLPLAFCMLLAHWKDGALSGVRGTLAVVGTYLCVIWLLLIQFKFDARLALGLAVAAAGILVYGYRNVRKPEWVIAGATLLALVNGMAFAGDSPYSRYLVASIGAMVFFGALLPLLPERARRPITALIVLWCVVVFWSPSAPTKRDLPAMPTLLALSLLGASRLGVLSATLLRRGVLFPLCFVLTAVDLLGAARVHGDLATHAFLNEKTPYPPLAHSPGDFSLHRAVSPNVIVASATYLAEHGKQEDLSSFNVAYGIPSYAGYMNSVPSSYLKFVESFSNVSEMYAGPPILNGFISRIKDPRALSLLGVGEGSVARFQMFKRYEVALDPLKRLHEKSFAPLGAVVLEHAAAIPSADGPSVAIRPIVKSSDDIEVAVGDAAPGVLLFNDSFHRGWRALVDGEPATIQRANANFMAIAVPMGARRVSFSFEPPLFWLAVRLACLGMVLTAAITYGAKIRSAARYLRASPSPQEFAP